eukprot:g6658.t1
MRWSAERWEEARCFVQEVGIEYTGDCNLRVDEEELPFDYGAWPPVKKSSAETCLQWTRLSSTLRCETP